MKERIKVCQVLNAYRVGGAETIALDVASGLDPEAFESIVVAVIQDRKDTEPEMRRRFRDAGVATHALYHKSFRDPRTLLDLIGFFRRTRPDIIHAHNRFADYWAWRCGGYAGVRHRIWTRHSVYRDMSERQLKRYQSAAQSAAVVLAVSDAVRDNCIAIEGIPEEKVRTIVNGIDVDRFRPSGASIRAEKRRELCADDDTAVLLMVGRLLEIKGPDLFLALVERLRMRGIQARGYICGAGPMAAELTEHASRAGVTMLGLRNDIPALLAAADLVVSTSRVEGLPLNIMEAMSAGAAFVAPDLAQIAQLVDGVPLLAGCLFERPPLAGTVSEPLLNRWSDFVESRLRDAETLRRCGELGRATIVSRFSARQMIEEHESLYRSIYQNGLG